MTGRHGRPYAPRTAPWYPQAPWAAREWPTMARTRPGPRVGMADPGQPVVRARGADERVQAPSELLGACSARVSWEGAD